MFGGDKEDKGEEVLKARKNLFQGEFNDPPAQPRIIDTRYKVVKVDLNKKGTLRAEKVDE